MFVSVIKALFSLIEDDCGPSCNGLASAYVSICVHHFVCMPSFIFIILNLSWLQRFELNLSIFSPSKYSNSSGMPYIQLSQAFLSEHYC